MDRFQIKAGLVAVVGLAVFAPGYAAAQSELGPYVAVGLGYNNMPDRNLQIFGRQVSSQWDGGVAGLAALGYKWSSGLRTELEISGRVSEVKTFNDVAPWVGKQWANSVMVNALYDFNRGGKINPYIGVGLGGTQVVWGDNFRAPTQGVPIVYDGSGVRMGWQGIAGLSYAVTPKIALALDGRLNGAFGDYKFPGSVRGINITHFNYRSHGVFASVRYSFGKQ